MKKEQLVKIISLVVLILGFSISIAVAEERMKGSPGNKGSGSMDPEQAAMFAKWQKFATPNENHKLLDSIVGS